MRVSSMPAAVAGDRVLRRVELEAGVVELLADRAAGAAQQRSQPRAELLERERLDEVVVGAGVEPLHAVRDGVARGEHQHGRAVAGGPQAAADLEPVGLGHQDVEDDRVGRLVGERVERLAAVGGELDAVAVHPQRAVERVADARLVVDHEDSHTGNPQVRS